MAVRLADAVPRDETPSRGAVTVAEVQRVVLAGGRVAGGSGGLHQRVTWATTLRSRPPAFELRGGGEFVLATQAAVEGLRQVDSGLTLERILEGLSQAGAAALAIDGPIPARARAAANALALPLIEMPAHVSLLDAERGIIGLVLDRHNELQTRASEFYRRLAQLTLEGRGINAIVDEASRATGRLATFEDAHFRLRAVASPVGETTAIDDAGLSSIAERGRLGELIQTQPLSSTTPAAVHLSAARVGLERYAAPVVTRDRIRGFFSLCGAAQSLTDFDQLATSRAAAVCAIELAKEEAVLAAEQRVQRNVVEDLLRPGGDDTAARRRAVQAGLSLVGPYAAIVVAIQSGSDRHDDALLAASEAISRRTRETDLRLVSHAADGEVIVLCDLAPPGSEDVSDVPEPAGDGEQRLAAIADAVFGAAAREAPEGSLSAGVSRAHPRLTFLPQAAAEAREAVRIGRRVQGAGRIIRYADLGLYRVLFALKDSPELRTFYEQTLGPLVEYDRRTGQNLIETLEVFFECHGNLSQTAQRLHHHRNSLLYRIGRIQEISGLNLDDPDARLSLQVALKARRLLT